MEKETDKSSSRKRKELAHELSELVPELARVLHRATNAGAAQARSGILLRQAEALLLLATGDDFSVTGLARELGIAANTASELVERLVKKGYVRRKELKTDRRRKLLIITRKGKAEADRFRRAAEKGLRGRLASMSFRDQERLIASFRAIIRLLGDEEVSRKKGGEVGPPPPLPSRRKSLKTPAVRKPRRGKTARGKGQ